MKNKKLTLLDRQKILLRYNSKLEEFKTKSLDELKGIFNTQKMSSTDRQAIVVATNYIMKQLMIKEQSNNKSLEIEGE